MYFEFNYFDVQWLINIGYKYIYIFCSKVNNMEIFFKFNNL